MGKLNEQDFKLQLKDRSFSNVYMFYGEESYLKEFYIGRIKKAVVEPAFADFNLHQYEGRSASLDDILMDAQMIPMMSEYSLVIVHDFNLIKNKDDREKLKEFFKDIPETCILIFWFDSIEVNPKAEAKWNTVINNFAKAGDAVNFGRRTEGDLVKLVSSTAKKRGCTVDNSTARYLISVVGMDIQTIINETEKLSAFASGNEITRKIVDELAVKSLQAKVFDLSKFILAGNSDAAFNILRVLKAQKEEPIGILSVISSYYIDMYRAKCAKAAGNTEKDVTNYYTYKDSVKWILTYAAKDGTKMSFDALRNAIDVLANTDELMKSTGIDRWTLLEETVAKLLLTRNR